jgi:preprotein translocase subunit YajC
MLVAMVAIFYFFMIRPENKKKKKLAEMRASLAVGDTITTIGGIFGKVVFIDEDKITFETSEDRVRIQIAKWAVSTVGKAMEEPPKESLTNKTRSHASHAAGVALQGV